MMTAASSRLFWLDGLGESGRRRVHAPVFVHRVCRKPRACRVADDLPGDRAEQHAAHSSPAVALPVLPVLPVLAAADQRRLWTLGAALLGESNVVDLHGLRRRGHGRWMRPGKTSTEIGETSSIR